MAVAWIRHSKGETWTTTFRWNGAQSWPLLDHADQTVYSLFILDDHSDELRRFIHIHPVNHRLKDNGRNDPSPVRALQFSNINACCQVTGLHTYNPPFLTLPLTQLIITPKTLLARHFQNKKPFPHTHKSRRVPSSIGSFEFLTQEQKKVADHV